MLDGLPKEQAAVLREKFDAFYKEASKALQSKNKEKEEDENMKRLKRWPDGRVTIPKKMVADLVKLGKIAAEKHTFKPGDVVRWKTGLEHRDLGEDGLAVVTQVLDTPHRKPSKGRGHEDEILDIVIGTIVDSALPDSGIDDVFVELHTEKRRLEPAGSVEGEYVTKLRERHAKFAERERPFQKGDVVSWKEGMINKLVPKMGMPSIVVSVKETPEYYNELDTDSPYFCEPIDLIVLTEVNEKEGSFVMVGVDSRRMKLANQ